MIEQQLQELIRKYERQILRINEQTAELEQKRQGERLSIHGYWDMGYSIGKKSAYQDFVDDLQMCLEETKQMQENDLNETESKTELNTCSKEQVIDLFLKMKKVYLNVSKRYSKLEDEMIKNTDLDELIEELDLKESRIMTLDELANEIYPSYGDRYEER